MISQNAEKSKGFAEESQQNHPGYWAVIPASVRYDDQLRPNCKILYAEISALCNRHGYCWADTPYFAEQFGLGERAIQKLLALLEDRGYIRIEIVQKANQSQSGQRRIWLTEPLPLANKYSSAASAGEQKILAGEQKIQTTLNNNNINNNPPIAPQGAQGVSSGASRRHRDDYKSQADHLPERFEKFWKFYCDSIPDDRRKAGNRQKAIKAWDKLSPTPGLIHTMALALAEQIKGQSWQEGIGIPHASTWLNGHCWEDPTGAGSTEAPQARKDGWD